jgi:hypothetical protein
MDHTDQFRACVRLRTKEGTVMRILRHNRFRDRSAFRVGAFRVGALRSSAPRVGALRSGAFRLGAVLIGALALSAVTATAAHAAPYPPTPPVLTSTNPNAGPGQPVPIIGSGFLPGEIIDLTATLKSSAAGPPQANIVVPMAYTMPMLVPAFRLDSTRADANGNFKVTDKISTPGVYLITATGETSGRVATLIITVRKSSGGASSGNAGGGLPRTGSGFLGYATTGASLLGGGLILIFGAVLWRRRSQPSRAR